MSDEMRIWLYNCFSSDDYKLQKAKLFMLCDVILLVRLQDKFELDHSGSDRVKTVDMVHCPVLVCAYPFPISEFSEVG